ncbi:hypothetical protein SETIT_6G121900v2 [Setaria italica]|uniref:CCHC-type domain-containing protein n=1 Tax=Setaria italica TaxID=4555 RepID=A0A368RKP4_SETIT|nr:hypothetical protein SETIT_6G121900v2 [Setaria italica]
MKMHLYGLHPSIWEVVVVGVTPPKNRIPTAEQAQDYFRNAQAIRVITGYPCAQEFNKVRSIEIAKVIWDTLKEAHKGTNQVRQGKMDLIHGELEHFIMLEEGTVTQIFDRLILLVSDIITLGSTDWDDHKVTKKMIRAFTPRNPTLATIIRRDPSFKRKTPNQLLGEILHQKLVERDVAKSLSMRMNKSLALNASSSTMIESSPKALKSKKEDSNEEGSTDEETAFAIRNYKKFLKKKAFKKNGDDRKRTSQRRCYECKEVGHFIANYQAHVGQQWDSSDEKFNRECMATLAILKPTTPTKLFNNISDNEDDTPFCLMAKGTKVLNTTSSSSISSSISSNVQNELDDEEENIKVKMIKEFGKKGYKEIKKLLEKLEKKKESLNRQEDLLILEKERNLALEKALVEEKAKGEKLAIDLSLANDSHERMSKELTLANESLASLKANHSELQESFSCLTVKFKDLEVNYNALLESSKANSKVNLYSNASSSEGCIRCYKIDVNAYVTNIAKLEESIKESVGVLDRQPA